ncbi:HDOD domain-containing protein [Teredinibacter sp. KSP-S5-2]|uniref:HDOD domain-containing protein n=1 Tax=Teredinibacter sp. KSP-S5-2 TaxID=3034506 RepID=UPI002934DFC0|nr:HDOD domain-containing protein [Teredinibacter sp. KSP-S5-2]WNO08029.1 HDOD domain-containing protein [Teredinibacter sp. KSP-S5-2]
MSALAEKVAQEINKAIETDRLVLPTLPEMALRVREVAEDENASIPKLAAVISTDASLTARIIKVANSPLFRAAREIEDLNMALSRLGMQYTCNLATGLAMEQMFQATTDFVDKKLRETWTRSSEIAGICHVFCKHKTKLRPDQATLAGLTHQIGVLPILSFAEDHPSLLRDSFTLDKIINEIHPQLGVKILTTWEFPSEIRNVPVDHLNFTRQIAAPDYADLVTVAMLEDYAGDKGGIYANLDFSTVTAFDRLGLDPNIESAEAEDLSEDMEAAMKMLSG